MADLSSYRNKAESIRRSVERMAKESGKIGGLGEIDSTFFAPLLLSVLLVIGALIGLTIWLL